MAGRRIGRESFISDQATRAASSLIDVSVLLDWSEIDHALAGIAAAAKGEQGWPPLALFRAVLLASWHNLSDVRLAEALDDRASFRRFCGFATHEPTPERTAFVRFRAELVRCGLDRTLFDLVTRQLDRRGIVVQTGTLVDATLLPSASIRHDGEARWAGHRRRKRTHGYKAHMATDQDAAELEAVLPEALGDVCGDSAFSGGRSEAVIRGPGGTPRVLHTVTWVEQPRWLAWKLTTQKSAAYAVGSKRSSAPASVPMACAECAGAVLPKEACRSG